MDYCFPSTLIKSLAGAEYILRTYLGREKLILSLGVLSEQSSHETVVIVSVLHYVRFEIEIAQSYLRCDLPGFADQTAVKQIDIDENTIKSVIDEKSIKKKNLLFFNVIRKIYYSMNPWM